MRCRESNTPTQAWPASLILCAAFLAAANSASAQPISLSSPDRVQTPEVIELKGQLTPEEIQTARQAYQRGNIVRLINTSDDLIHQIAKGAATVNRTSVNGLTKRQSAGDRKSAIVDSVKAELGDHFTALRLDRRGTLHQFTSETAVSTPASVRMQAEAGYRQWEAAQLAGDTPQPPDEGYWTPVLSKVIQDSGDWGTTQSVIRVYRLNENDTSADYWMVITDPTVTPNVKTDVATNCYGLAYVECGWWTSSRDIQMSTSPAGILLSHGPNTPISTTTVSWTLGGVLSNPPGLTGAYTESWNQDSVTTADQSSTQNGVAHWVETFSEIQEFKTLPATAVSPFVSHQGAIFQLADQAKFTLNVTIGTTLHYFSPSFGSATVYPAGGGAVLSANLSPPDLSLTQNSTVIAPGGNGSMQVFADILGGDAGLDWNISNVPSWASLTQIKCTGTTAVGIQVAPGTPLGTTATLNIDSEHPYASPSTVQGPLKFQIKVGKPDLHGALIIGGAHFRSGSYDSLGSGLFYSASANDFVASVAMNQPRSYHNSTVLADGTILVAAGRNTSDTKSGLASAEIYDQTTASFNALSNRACPGSPGCMITAAWNRVATRLPDGRVLFTGGTNDGSACTAAAEVYNPSTQTFTALPNMAQRRCGHVAGLTPSGRVIISGGFSDYNYFDSEIGEGEIFNPATNSFSKSFNPDLTGYEQTSTRLDNGFLVTGGFYGHYGQAALSDIIALFDDSNAAVLPLVHMATKRANHTATRLQDGRVLITGGRSIDSSSQGYTVASAEIYNPATNTVSTVSGTGTCPGAPGCMLAPRAYHTATLLLDGRVLISGGTGSDLSTGLQTTELFDPKTNTFTAGPPFDGRVSHTAAQLRAPSSITLADPGPQTSGKPFTLSAKVTVDYPNALTGSVQFSSGDTQLGSASVVNGTAAITVKLSDGNYPVIAKYTGSDSFGPSQSNSLLIDVNATATSMTLASDRSTSTVGENITFTANIKGTGSTAPSGTVTFFDSGTELGRVPVTGTEVKFATSTLTAGTHNVSASYSGDENYQSDKSNVITQTVNALVAQVKLDSSANPAGFGAPINFTATLSAGAGAQGMPGGDVAFFDGEKQLGVVTAANAVAVYSTNTLTQGDHQITARYRGDATFGSGTSNAITQTVGVAPSTTVLTAPKNPVVYGQDPVTLNVSVTAANNAKPTGTVSITEGGNLVTSGPLDANGNAQLTVTAGLPAGVHQLTASYAGNGSLAKSDSQALTLTVDHAATTTSLTVSPSNPSVGQTITLTATVNGPGSKQTGSVTFLDGSKTVGTAQLDAGVGVATVNSLGAGNHSLTAVYAGDANYSSSTSTATAITVQAVATTSKLTSSINPASLGDAAVLTAAVTSGNGVPTGKVAFARNGVQVALVDLNGGTASYPVPQLTPGTYNFTAAYQGEAGFAPSASSSLAQVINPARATIALSTSLTPSRSKSPVTFTAIVTGVANAAPSGSVTFLDGSTSLGVAPINSNGQAALTTSTLSNGTHRITATWNGDDNYASATSPAITQTVNPAVSDSTTTLASSKNPSSVGETVTFTVNVQRQDAGTATPTGTVTLLEGATVLGSAVLNNGTASIPVNTLSAANHAISASYGGDTNFSASTSAAITQVVNAAPTATITLTSQTNPSFAGVAVNLIANVKGSSGSPGGSVSFLDGSTVLGSATLVNGVATYPAALSTGTHNLTAVYGGDPTFPKATSATYQQRVNLASSSVVLTSSANPSSLDQSVTFRAVVTTAYSNPTGTVTFMDGSTVLGTSNVASGAASFNTSTLTGGSHSITAKYSGDANVSASTSPILTQVVNAQFKSVATVTSNVNPSKQGGSVSFTITVTSAGGGVPTGSVTLSEGATIYGSSFLTNGSAVIVVPNLSAGSHVMFGTYGSDATHLSATSAPYTQQVTSTAMFE